MYSPPNMDDLAKMQREVIGSEDVPEGYALGIAYADRLLPHRTVTCNTLPTSEVRLAWLVVPDEVSLRRRRQYVKPET